MRPRTYIGADGRTYELIWQPRGLRLDWRGTARDLWQGAVQAVAGIGGLVGAITAIVLVGGPCLAAGPIGWLAGLFLVPPAAAVGFGLGAAGFLIGLPLLALAFALQIHR